MAKRHSFDRWSETGSGKHNRDQARRVGLNRQMAEVEEQTRAADEVSRVGDVLGGSTFTLGFGFFDQLSSMTIRCSRARTLERYSSSLSRSSLPRLERNELA